MSAKPLQSVVRHLRRVVARQGATGSSDAELLERFLRCRDEGAFELLVWRHGGMVLGVCRSVLNAHDADDAFQATFLALLRQGASISRGEAIAGWLYRVAHRTARRLRTTERQRAQRPIQDSPATPADPAEDAARKDLRLALCDEVNGLAERERAPVVLCYLEGKTAEEAARQLGCPRGTVLSRLARARERLRDRLVRRGLTLSAAALTAELMRAAAWGAPPPALVDATVAAARHAAGGTVAALTTGGLSTMFLTRLRTMAAILLAAGALVALNATFPQPGALASAGGDSKAEAKGTAKGTAKVDGDKGGQKPKADRERILGTWDVVKVLRDGEEVPKPKPKGARLLITREYMFLKNGDQIVEQVQKYQLDPSQTPKAIDLEWVGHADSPAVLAVYAFEGDTLKLCGPERGKDRPTEVASKPGSKHELIVAKRAATPEKIDDKWAEAFAQKIILRRKSARNLQYIGLALHNHNDKEGRLPPFAIHSNEGKPLLSWRVAILPFLGQGDLYQQFKLDEPWDSAHNKKLLEKMPEIYAPVAGKTKEPHATFYRVFVGPGVAFDGKEGVKLEDFADGLSRSVLAVEAREAVPWTKPAELTYDANALPKLGGMLEGGFHLLLGDGSVIFVQSRFNEEAMRRLITHSDGKGSIHELSGKKDKGP